ncbi:MAG: DMT family transporter [Polyangiales bacterium]
MKDAQAADRARGALCGLTAAALFGVSAPIATCLLGAVPAVLLAGLLYAGAAIGLSLYRLWAPRSAEASLLRADLWKLGLVILTGGVIAPILMLLGLQRVGAMTGSLLLNLEAPFTMLLALALFGEHLGRNGIAAAVLIVAGAALLKVEPGELGADTRGVLLLAAACLCWAIDNNLTQRLSLRDPFAVVRAKALGAGIANTLLGLVVTQGELPPLPYLAGALLLGSLSYGVSVLLDAYALRLVGAAREAAYFATAPFVGALVAWLLLSEPLQWHDVLAMAVMSVGVVYLLRERHSHVHVHEPLEHEHLHVHDDHHQHAHPPGQLGHEPHSHKHHHALLTHEHPHVSDAHHRHRH